MQISHKFKSLSLIEKILFYILTRESTVYLIFFTEIAKLYISDFELSNFLFI